MLSAELLFPSSPNWYIAHSIDALPNGTLAFATNQAVTVVDGTRRHVTGVCNVRGRVTGVALGAGHLAACTAEKGVHAFDLASLTQAGSHKDHHAEPSCIIILAPGLCVTGDRRGTVCFWALPGAGLPGKGLERLCPHRDGCVCLAANAAADRVAVGYASGTVAVVDVAARTVSCTFQHASPVQCLSWAGGSFLASSCQDQAVQIWRLGEDGQAEIVEEVSKVLKRHEGSESRVWVSVLAVSESAVVFGGPRGELQYWDAEKRKVQRAAAIHTRPIFGIRPVGSDHIATASMDRSVVLWSLGKGVPQMKWRVCCLGGHVTCVRTDGANLACVGCGDGTMRVMDLMHREHRQHCWLLWRGLRAPMTSACFGPLRELWAYGMQDGSFGALLVNATEGPMKVEPLSSKSHPGPVTSVCWLRTRGFGGGEEAEANVSPAAAAEGAEAAEEGEPKGEEQKGEEAKGDEQKGAEQKGAAAKGKAGKKAAEDKFATKDVKPLLKGLCLVSLSAGHEIQITQMPPTGSKGPKSIALQLESLQGLAAAPSAAASWPLAELGDVLVVAAAHRPRGESLEANSLQLFQPADAEGEGLRCVAALPAEGLAGGVTCLSLWAPPGQSPRCCRALCGTAKGGLALFRLLWPPPSGGHVPCWPLELSRTAHAKSVADVQWREPLGDGEEMDLLSAGADGSLKVWHFKSSITGVDLQCLHSFGGPVSRLSGGALLSACWDVSAGGSAAAAVLAGGRDQVLFRYVPGETGAGDQDVAALQAAPEAHLEPIAGISSGPRSGGAGGLKAPATAPAPASSSGGPARGPKQRTKQAVSLVSLASAALYQQSSKARALELVRLVPGALELWPGEERMAEALDAGGAGPPSLTAAIFTNQQAFADSWVEKEVENKLQASMEERAVAVHRARLLKLWATDVQEALALEQGEDAAGPSDGGLSSSWLWAALSPAGEQGSWESAVGRLIGEASRGGAAADAVHHAAAAALALDRADEAIRLYMQAELPADALLLARLRLPARHPLVAHAYEQFAADLKRRARHDQAAACRLAIGQLGAALSDIEEMLPAARPTPLGPDPVRLAASFVAASVAEGVASARLRASASNTGTARAAEEEDTPPDSEEDCDPAFAYDHRSWWAQRELRVAVQAWRRCLVEALHAGRLPQALALARVEVRRRSLSAGERFLRAALAGYASATAWWLQLHAPEEAEAEAEAEAEEDCGGDHSLPLQRFLDRGRKAVAPEGDFDFEWRAATWLPAFEPGQDPVLTAAVELSRACASLASGASRGTSDELSAPWGHVTSAVAALLGVDKPQALARPLRRLGALARQPGGAAAARAAGECVAASAGLAAGEETAGGSSASNSGLGSRDPWSRLNRVLFGLPCSECPAAAASEALRRGLRLAGLVRPGTSPSAALQRAAAAVASGSSLPLTAASLCEELERALLRAVDSCGLRFEKAAVDTQASLAPQLNVEDCLAQLLRRVHGNCISPVLVPLALAAWCQRFCTRPSQPARPAPTQPAGREENEAPEYEEVRPLDLEAEQAPTWAAFFRIMGDFLAEAAAEADAEAAWEGAGAGTEDEAEALQGLVRLESLKPLAWPARLALLRKGLEACGDGGGHAAAVCELLAAL